jgi:hypothetical protein
VLLDVDDCVKGRNAKGDCDDIDWRDMRSFVLALLIISSVSVLGRHAAQQTKPKLTQADEEAIREAVFRYQFEHNASAQKQTAKVYFLSIGDDKDPSDAFMARFDKHKPPVKKLSQAPGPLDVNGKEIGDPGGLIFSVTTIEPVDEDKVLVNGGYYEGNLSASGNVYAVERKDHKWVVTKDQMLWIS